MEDLEQKHFIDVHVRERHVPLLFVLFIFSIAVGGAALLTARFREDISYNYNILLAEGTRSATPLVFGAWPELANIEFFRDVRSRFIAEKTNFIEADLSAMKIGIYLGGERVKEFPILTKGKEGSWWETPAGLYDVLGKEKQHFSTFGKVYTDYNLQFQGNFFIHGWPYYPDGTPVPLGYSGGCIRLSTQDAKELFDLAEKGMPVLVYEKDFENDHFRYRPKGPGLAAKSYLAADLNSNFVLVEQAGGEVVPVASLTKLVTALVATDYVNIEKTITITPEMAVETSYPRFKGGEIYSLYDLLYPLLLESSNEAAAAISRFLGPKRFVELMNEKAKAIGMRNSHFVEPAGSDGGNVSTAEDLFTLAKYLYHNRRFLLDITKGDGIKSIYGQPKFSGLKNFNVFGDNPEFVGGKTGKSTAAGEVILSIFETDLGGARRPVALIILNSPNYTEEARRFYSWVKSAY